MTELGSFLGWGKPRLIVSKARKELPELIVNPLGSDVDEHRENRGSGNNPCEYPNITDLGFEAFLVEQDRIRKLIKFVEDSNSALRRQLDMAKDEYDCTRVALFSTRRRLRHANGNYTMSSGGPARDWAQGRRLSFDSGVTARDSARIRCKYINQHQWGEGLLCELSRLQLLIPELEVENKRLQGAINNTHAKCQVLKWGLYIVREELRAQCGSEWEERTGGTVLGNLEVDDVGDERPVTRAEVESANLLLKSWNAYNM
ncbi:hypothetical protein VNI00_000073 [Paramarasmius palmivorus]|uniref:Uncharacterized protein n=1 Tax=Paramarasmius palmivorus TaxID=297713 RepID=A0AAW0ECK3_9AGAR